VLAEKRGAFFVSYNQMDILKAKKIMNENVGARVLLTVKKSHKDCEAKKGTIISTYPSVFVIKLDSNSDNSDYNKTVSFSYADLLTGSVRLVLYSENEKSAEESA
jgi:uncharacterized protein Veg